MLFTMSPLDYSLAQCSVCFRRMLIQFVMLLVFTIESLLPGMLTNDQELFLVRERQRREERVGEREREEERRGGRRERKGGRTTD